MKELIEIESIKIKLNDKLIELTPEEAKAVAEELANIFSPLHSPAISYPNGKLNCNPNVEPFPDNWDVKLYAYKDKPSTLEIYAR